MKALFVYESLDFERGGDPKKALGIGKSYWEKLDKGSILLITKRMGLTSSGRITSGNSYENILPPSVVILSGPISNYVGEWIIQGNRWQDIESYLKFIKSRRYKKGGSPKDYETPGYYGWKEFRGKPGTIKNRLEIIDLSKYKEKI